MGKPKYSYAAGRKQVNPFKNLCPHRERRRLTDVVKKLEASVGFRSKLKWSIKNEKNNSY